MKLKVKRLEELVCNFHKTELNFFIKIAPYFQAYKNELPFKIPKLYYGKENTSSEKIDGYLLIEDIANSNTDNISLVNGLTKEQVINFI